MELDDCFQQRDLINSKILIAMEEATSAWGVKVTRCQSPTPKGMGLKKSTN